MVTSGSTNEPDGFTGTIIPLIAVTRIELPGLRLFVSTGDPLVTNVFPRTFPKGQSLELIEAGTFAAIDPASLDRDQQEHATKVYYDNPCRFRILNLAARGAASPDLSLAVDTLEDLQRLERLAETCHD